MNPVLPQWLDQVPGVDFTPEKRLLTSLEKWAAENGWEVTDGANLRSELRWRTDVLLEQPSRDRRLRIAVLPKAKRGPGMIRVDASTHRIFELVYRPRSGRWRLETAAVPLLDDIEKDGWDRLMHYAFRE